MVRQSFFYWLIIWLKDNFVRLFNHSVVGRICIAVRGFFSKIWRSSATQNILLGSEGLQRGFEKGISGRALQGFGGLAAKSSGFFMGAFEESRLLLGVRNLCENLSHISLRSYGIMLFIMGGIPTVISFVADGYVPLLLAAVAVLGIPLLLLNRSFAQLYNGSWIMKKTLGFFFVENMGYTDKPRQYLPLFLVFGLAFGTLAVFLDLTLFIMIFGGIIGGILVMYKTEIGIFAAAFLIPIVPTMLVLGLFAVIILSFVVKAFITGKSAINFSPIDVFVLLFGAIVAHSLIISYNTASSAPVVLVYLLYILFYFAVKNTINTRQKLFAILSIIGVSGLLVAAYGVWQRLTGNFVMTEAWLDTEFFDQTMVRIYSTLENPNVLGEYLIFVMIIAFGMIYYFRDYLYKFAAMGILAVAGVCMIFTQSRGAWLGLIFALGIYALVRDRRLVVLGIIGLVAAPFFIPPEVLMRFVSIGDLADGSTSFRVSIWLGSLDMIRVFWPIGIGLGTETFTMIYNLYAFSAAHALHSHNLYMQLIIDLGIGGLILLVLIISGFAKRLFVTGTGSKDVATRTVAAVLVAAVLGYLLQGMTDNVWFNYRVLAFFWLILGLGCSSALKAEGKDVENGEN